MKRLILALSAVVFSAGLVFAANIPLISTFDPSQGQATINALIQSINSGLGGNNGSQLGAVATATGTGEQILQTVSVPANTLVNPGDQLIIRCAGTTAANANNKTMKLYFGTSSFATPTAATNALNWELTLTVVRTASATETVIGNGTVGLTPVTIYTNLGTDDLTTALTAKCTGTDGTSSAGDITAQIMTVRTNK